jgi:hypothetical protein
LRQSERARRKIGLEKTAAVCVFCEMGGDGKGRTPDASCESGQAIEKAQNVMGGYWKKLAWIWLWRRSRVGLAAHARLGLAPRPLRRDHANSRRDKSHQSHSSSQYICTFFNDCLLPLKSLDPDNEIRRSSFDCLSPKLGVARPGLVQFGSGLDCGAAN